MRLKKRFATFLKDQFYTNTPGTKRSVNRHPSWWTRLGFRSLPRLRLTHQLIGFFVIVVLLPMLALSVTIYNINKKAVQKQIAQFTYLTAQASIDELREELYWQGQQTQLTATHWVTLLKLPTSDARNAAIRQFFIQNPDVRTVTLYNPKLHRALPFQSPLASYTANPAATALLSQPPSNEIVYSLTPIHRPHHTTGISDYALSIRVPISASGWQTLVVDKRFSKLKTMMENRFRLFQNQIVLVDSTGTIIAGPGILVGHSINHEDQAILNALHDGEMRELTSRQSALGLSMKEDTSKEEQKLQRVFIKLPNLKLGMVIESPYSLQRQFILRASLQSIALLAACIVAIIILGLFYSRGINRNFRQLIKGIKALAEGRYSRRIRLITKTWTPYEIIYLTAEFNRMAHKIHSAWNSIQTLNQELVTKNENDLFVAQAIQRLHNSLELEAVCQTATDILLERPEMQGAILFLFNEQHALEAVAQSSKGSRYPFGLPMTLLIEHIEQRFDNYPYYGYPRPHLLDSSDARHTFIYPIQYRENLLGALALLRQSLNGARDDEAMILEMLSVQVGVAIYQARQWAELQLANRQLAKLDEMKSNLIDTVSHELRTPLTNIKGYTSRLMRYDGTLDTDTRLKSLKVIKQQADRLSRLVEDLLTIPELEGEGGIRVYLDRVNINNLIDRSVQFITEKAHRDIQGVGLDHPIDILADPDRIEQVMLNLLDNAVKYAPEEAAIEVRLIPHWDDRMVDIQVFNTYTPIPAHETAQLFDKFKRLDERLTRTTRGTGLGLFITRGLVEAMGGTIRLDGKDGFLVTIRLPMYDDVGTTPPRSPESVLVTE